MVENLVNLKSLNKNKKSAAPDPFKYAASASDEMALQISVFMWSALPDIRELYPELKFLFSVPNGMYTNKIQAGKFRAAGMKSGVPDMFLPVKRGEFSGLWIELKRPKTDEKRQGQATPEQKIWIDFLKAQGYGAIICYGFEETIAVLQEYLNYKKPRNWSSKANDMKEFEG